MQSTLASTQVIQAHGSLNASNAAEFQAQLHQHIQSDFASGLVVDMSQLESLDSAGLISLISALKLARKLSKRFCLCAVPPTIRIVFELTRLDQVFEMVDELPRLPMAA